MTNRHKFLFNLLPKALNFPFHILLCAFASQRILSLVLAHLPWLLLHLLSTHVAMGRNLLLCLLPPIRSYKVF